MPALVHMVLCADAIVDSATNRVTLYGVLEEVQVPGEALEQSLHDKILASGPIAVYGLLSREWPTEEPQQPLAVQLRLRMPEADPLDLASIAFEAPLQRTRVIFRLEGLPLHGAGLYTFELLQGQDVIGRAPLRVRAADPIPAPPPGHP